MLGIMSRGNNLGSAASFIHNSVTRLERIILVHPPNQCFLVFKVRALTFTGTLWLDCTKRIHKCF